MRNPHFVFNVLPRLIPGLRAFENVNDADDAIDEDVAAEKKRIQNGEANDDMIR